MSDLNFLKGKVNITELAQGEQSLDGDYEPLKPGWYHGRITEAAVQETKAGTGKMVYCRIDIEGPTAAGRVVFDRMLVEHTSSKAEEIGRARFATLCMACGINEVPNETSVFLGQTVTAKLKIEKNKEYGDRNRVAGYKKHEGAESAAPVAPFNDDDVPF